jgi:orotidine-5'-phosphate decarboxylase
LSASTGDKERQLTVDSNLARVAVALDTPDRDEFDQWCRFFGPRVGVLKVGLECFYRFGSSAVEEARRHAAALFLDLKLHDIPNTVAGAVASVRSLGADLITVHAAGGSPMLEAAVAAAGETRILAVTLLTHLGDAELAELDLHGPGMERVKNWALLARRSGCAGVVSSPRELESLRPALAPPFLLVTPGIRPSGSGHDDQRRVATPAEALAGGSDLLVIGRPLTRASDPEAALDRLAREIAGTRDSTLANQ